MNKLDNSDFWVTLASTVIGAFAVLVHMTTGDQATVQTAVSRTIVAGFALVSSAAVVWKYLHGLHAITLAQVVADIQLMFNSPPTEDDDGGEQAKPPTTPPLPDGHTYIQL